MNTLVTIYTNHPYISTLASYWFLSAFIGALPAPMAASSQIYVFFYKFTNSLGGNIVRALSTRVEASPNFQAAVNNVNAQAPVDKPVVVVDPNAPSKP